MVVRELMFSFTGCSLSSTEARARATPHRGASVDLRNMGSQHDAFIPARSGMLDSDWLTDVLGRRWLSFFFSPGLDRIKVSNHVSCFKEP